MEPTQTASAPKSFFERYQTFIAIVICGILVAGGLIVSRVIPAKGSLVQNEGQTLKEAKKEMNKAAKSIGLDTKAFAACVDDGTNVQKVNDAIALAEASGVTGTPTFFVLKRSKAADGTMKINRQTLVLGARDEATLEQVIKDGKVPADQPEQPAGEPIVLSETDHYMGPADAEVVILEYSDIDCPFCKRAKPMIDSFLAKHPDYAFVYRHSPIISLHPNAGLKAAASECAADLGGPESFWKFIDIVAK